MDSHALEAFCLDASYISAFDILNIPSLAIPDSAQQLSSNLSWLARSNITAYTSDPASILLNNFKYQVTSLPLAKPLAIQCTVPACVFPIGGYFTFLQRLLLYINMGIASFALHIPLLRGVSQIWLTTFWFSVLAMYLATLCTTRVPMIYNLDLQPAALVVHIGLLPTLLWFSFRAEPGERRRSAEDSDKEARGRTAKDKSRLQRWKKEFSDFPVTRILVPLYALWGVMNIIVANVVQDSAGFWPKATAVVLSNGTDYLITSPCFEDPTGFVGLWPSSPNPYNGIRALNSLSIYYPPPGSKAVDALQAVPRTDLTVLHVGSVLICFIIIVLSFIKLSWLEDWLHERYRNRWHCNRMIQYLTILPFMFPLFLAVVITLYVIIVFEINAHGAALPENEAYTEIGQWGPYVVAALVCTATLVAKSKDWDFDNIQNRGFEWLLK